MNVIFHFRLHDFFLFLRLTKLMFFFANDEHRTGRRSHHALRRAADAKMFPTGVSVRGDHDQIDIGFFGRFDNLMRR